MNVKARDLRQEVWTWKRETTFNLLWLGIKNMLGNLKGSLNQIYDICAKVYLVTLNIKV